MATIGWMEKFCSETENFSAYVECVEFFFSANGIDTDKKAPVLLSVNGGKTYALLRDLIAPDHPKDKSFKQIVEALQALFEPKPLVIAERFNFHRRDQLPRETVAGYIAELRRLATKCSFGSYLEEALRDRLACALRDESIQRWLLTHADLDLATAIKSARSMEAAQSNGLTQRSQTERDTFHKMADVSGQGKSSGQGRKQQPATVVGRLHICNLLASSRR